MDLEMVLNELSLSPLASDVYDARLRMAGLIQTIVQATSSGVKKVLRTSSTLYAEDLAPEYPVARWLNDPQVDKDTQRFFRTLTTKAPFLVDVNDKKVQDAFGLSEFFYEDRPAIGLGVAFLLEALALSLQSEACWHTHKLELTINQIGEDEEVIDSIIEIPHASNSYHVYEHAHWIKMRLESEKQNALQNGMDIWNHKDQWFPNLYFCESVKENLSEIYHGDLVLGQVLKKLQELEEYCNSWLNGPFDHTKIKKATPETLITLETYGQEHTFKCHDGAFRLFSQHIRLTPGAWRIYFFPLAEERKLIIGYIGFHLPTVDYH